MVISLNHHMDALFHYGLTLIQKNESSIQKELAQLKIYFKHHGKRTTPSTIKSVDIFSSLIFNKELSTEIMMQKMRSNWIDDIGSNSPISPFMMSLIESSVHHVIQSSSINDHTAHQSIQYFFLKMNQHIHTVTANDPFSMDTFLQQLVFSKQLPIEWIAIVKQENNQFILKNWFQKNRCILVNDPITAHSIFELTDILLQRLYQPEEHSIMTVPYQNETLLISTLKKETAHIMPFIHYAVQFLESGKKTIQQMAKSQQWMEAVLLFNESIIRAHTLDSALEMITAGFVHYLPFKRCAIFSYSNQDEIVFGLSSHQLDSKIIRGIAEEMNNMPLIKHSLDFIQMLGEGIKYLQPLYVEDAKNYFPGYYIEEFKLKSVVITPLYKASSNELIGAAVLDQGENSTFKMSFETYYALIHFGKSAGETLYRYNASIKPIHSNTSSFSPREMEVLSLMAEGESTTSAAQSLHLSEYTVRDYITTIMQKMKARNRTEAVARAIRNGVI